MSAPAQPPAPARTRSWRIARFIARAAMTLVVVAAAVICLGFAWFVYHVPAEEVALERKADGIVVLTGGA